MNSKQKSSAWTAIGAARIFIAGVGGLACYYWAGDSASNDANRLRAIVATLDSKDSNFITLRVVVSTHPRAWVFGDVPTDADARVLRSAVAEYFTPEQTARIVSQVHIKLKPATEP